MDKSRRRLLFASAGAGAFATVLSACGGGGGYSNNRHRRRRLKEPLQMLRRLHLRTTGVYVTCPSCLLLIPVNSQRAGPGSVAQSRAGPAFGAAIGRRRSERRG